MSFLADRSTVAGVDRLTVFKSHVGTGQAQTPQKTARQISLQCKSGAHVIDMIDFSGRVP